MGAAGQPLAAGYAADVWAERWFELLAELVGPRRDGPHPTPHAVTDAHARINPWSNGRLDPGA